MSVNDVKVSPIQIPVSIVVEAGTKGGASVVMFNDMLGDTVTRDWATTGGSHQW